MQLLMKESERNWASSRSNPFMSYPCRYIAFNKYSHYKTMDDVPLNKIEAKDITKSPFHFLYEKKTSSSQALTAAILLPVFHFQC